MGLPTPNPKAFTVSRFTRPCTILVAAAAAGSIVAATPALAAHKSKTPSTTATTTTISAPTGQTTTVQTLANDGSAFSTGLGGWTSIISPVAWIPTVGHTAPGALAVTASGIFTGATSARFSVTPGARYSAQAWTQAAATGHQVSVTVRFFDASGTLIPGSAQMSQPVTNSPSAWTQTYRVFAFAPSNAATGAVIVNTADTLTGLVDYFDDVTVWKTTGVPAPLVGPFTTSGSNVLDAHGRRVQLHGVQLAGMRYSTWDTTNTVSTAEIDAAHRWGANFVRLELAENLAIKGDCSYNSSYLPTVDRIVNDATSRGMMILLDLHSNAVTECGDWTSQQKMPDTKAITFWQTLAARYKSQPLVAFDLYNEPHDVSDSMWHSGGSLWSGTVMYTAAGMQKLYDTIRSTGAKNLVFASGNGWATTYPSGAPLTNTKNLVWAVHAYTCPSATPANGGTCQSGPNGVTDPSTILDHFATVGETQPVMITEFGWPDPNSGDYLTNGEKYATAHNWVGWNAFSFNNWTGSIFDLIKDTTTWNPRSSGMAVMNGMLTD